ncbi:MAG TPA: chaperone modulator CbpM [Stellaceae bacterium]|nr:chaperone modulator CbpM [Stellaceae bacterium]
MMRIDAVVGLFPDLEVVELRYWIEQRWVQPEPIEGETWIFQAVDLARVHLIYDLRRELDTPEETVSLVLSLLDQVYDLRRTVNTMKQAVKAQPPDVQVAILEAFKSASL